MANTTPSGCSLLDHCSCRRAVFALCMTGSVLDTSCNRTRPSASKRSETMLITLSRTSTFSCKSLELTSTTDLFSVRCFFAPTNWSWAVANLAERLVTLSFIWPNSASAACPICFLVWDQNVHGFQLVAQLRRHIIRFGDELLNSHGDHLLLLNSGCLRSQQSAKQHAAERNPGRTFFEDFNEPVHNLRRGNVSNLFDDSLLDSALRHDFRHIDDCITDLSIGSFNSMFLLSSSPLNSPLHSFPTLCSLFLHIHRLLPALQACRERLDHSLSLPAEKTTRLVSANPRVFRVHSIIHVHIDRRPVSNIENVWILFDQYDNVFVSNHLLLRNERFDNTRAPERYTPLNPLIRLEWHFLLTHIFDRFTIRSRKFLWGRIAFEFGVREQCFKHHMARGSGVHGDVHPSVLHFGDFFLGLICDSFLRSAVMLDWLSSSLVFLVC